MDLWNFFTCTTTRKTRYPNPTELQVKSTVAKSTELTAKSTELTTKSTELTTKPNPSKKIIEQLPESSKQLIKPKTCHIILTFMLSSKNSYDICMTFVVPVGFL